MTESNFWADFVRWVSTFIVDKDKSARIMGASDIVSTRGEARAAIFAAHGGVATETIDVLEAQWLRDHAPPAETRSVDVPPGGGKDALLRLAEELARLAVAKTGDGDENAFNLGLKCAAAIAVSRSEEL